MLLYNIKNEILFCDQEVIYLVMIFSIGVTIACVSDWSHLRTIRILYTYVMFTCLRVIVCDILLNGSGNYTQILIIRSLYYKKVLKDYYIPQAGLVCIFKCYIIVMNSRLTINV